MSIDADHLLALEIPERRQSYSRRDCMLYALGLGCGFDPVDPRELDFVYEKRQQVLPTMAVVLAHPGFWMRDLDTGIDWVRLVHAGQSLEIHAPLPLEANVVGQNRVVDVIDKGEGRGALVMSERRIIDTATDTLLATVGQTAYCRNDGGFGGAERAAPQPVPSPDRPADKTVEIRTSPDAAMIYRLSGDYNPLHVDPEVAQKAGFPRPILHGLATYGIAGRALIAALCDFDAAKLGQIEARFTAPVLPGATLVTQIWQEPGAVRFRVTDKQSNRVAIDNAQAALTR